MVKNPDDIGLSEVDGLATLANNPDLSVEVQEELAEVISLLAGAIDEAAIKREAALPS